MVVPYNYDLKFSGPNEGKFLGWECTLEDSDNVLA